MESQQWNLRGVSLAEGTDMGMLGHGLGLQRNLDSSVHSYVITKSRYINPVMT